MVHKGAVRFIGTDLYKLMVDKYEVGDNPICLTESDYKLYTEIIDEKYKQMGQENKGGYTFRGREVKQL
jgi:hypothetical protein